MKGANADPPPSDIDRAADVLKTCDLILMQLEVPLETVYAAIAFGKRHGVKTVLNPAPATAALDVDRIRDVTFFIPNETELAILTGMPVDTELNIVTAARASSSRGRQNCLKSSEPRERRAVRWPRKSYQDARTS